MKTIHDPIRLLLLFILLFSAFGSAQAADKAELWPSDALNKVMRSDMPKLNGEQSLQITAARTEIASSQAVFRPNKDVSAATVSITDLRQTKDDAIIPASAVKLHWVRYIDINRNTAGIPDDELVAKAPVRIPDPFWEVPTIPVKANEAQPIWIEINIPKNARAGDYQGKLAVTTETESLELFVKLHVWDFDVPSHRHLSVINWWRFPGLGFEEIKSLSE